MKLSEVENVFSGGGLDRASDKRRDGAWVAARWAEPGARVVTFGPGGFSTVEGRLALRAASEVAPPALFLGLDALGPLFAVEVEDEFGETTGLRSLAPGLPRLEANLAATAQAVFAWHGRHRFCANCGAATDWSDAGWKRTCPACQAQHFPRTDPVVIMLPTRGEQCLLGRGASWPEGRFSALAGFLEPGESIEAACARELKEESGLETVRVRYHSSQPWPLSPLGGQLMIGLLAEVADGPAEADGVELSEVRWFTRGDARRLLDGTHPEASAPPPMAIAHQLLRGWAAGGP